MNPIYDQLKQQFIGKKILVVGLGIQGGGVGVAKFFAEMGSHVTVTDLKNESQLQESIEALKEFNINYSLGKHTLEDFLNADVIFKNPSVKWTLPELIEAEKKGVQIEMETSFFAAYSPAKMIGITGTRGKSTTTQMIYEMIKKTGLQVYLAGNVRNTSTISLLKTVTPEDLVVLELSSWQLSGFHKRKVSPQVSVFTNFYPDHLNYYASMDEYWYDKSAIYLYQTESEHLIANENLKERISKESHSHLHFFNSNTFTHDLNIQGDHNKENAGAAYEVGKVLGIQEKIIIDTLTNFKGLPYRIEKRATIQGVEIYNDTTSTTPIATEIAIDTFKSRQIILILGGNSKRLPYDSLIQKLSNVKSIILLNGTFTDEIFAKLDQNKIVGNPYDNLNDAIEKAVSISAPEDIILFSPGATSFASFKNEFDRGDQFNTIVKAYEQKHKTT